MRKILKNNIGSNNEHFEIVLLKKMIYLIIIIIIIVINFWYQELIYEFKDTITLKW